MSETAQPAERIRFDCFEANLARGELRKHGVRLKVHDQPFQVLAMLVARPGELVSREEIQAALWPDGTFVDFENGLNSAVNRLRDALGDSADEPKFIETVPRRGYRFIGPVERLNGAAASLPAEVKLEAQAKPRSFRWILAISAVLLIAGSLAGYEYLSRRNRIAASGEQRPVAIAVLPFINLTGDEHKEYLCDGMTEEMITVLGGLSPGRLAVIARTSSMTFKNSNQTAADIGRSLRVNYLLESSVREATNRFRINAQLIRTSDEVHLWAKEYDFEMSDVVKVQDEVANAIAQEIQVQLPTTVGNRRRTTLHAANPKAYEAYLRGRFFWNKRSAPSTRTAIGYFQDALREDPTYAPAYSGLADSYIIKLPDHPGPLPEPTYEQAKDNATKAVELDESLAEAHTSLAYLEFLGGATAAAETEFQQALELNPSYANAHHWFALFLWNGGRIQEAMTQFDEALKSDPLSVPIHCNAAMAYMSRGQTDKAKALLDQALELEPNSIFVHGSLANLYLRLGKHNDSAAEFQKAADLTGELSNYQIMAAQENARAGNKRQAETALTKILDRWKKTRVPISPYMVASTCAVLGQNEQAFYWLNRALQEHETDIPTVEAEPGFESLRSDRRWVSMRRGFAK